MLISFLFLDENICCGYSLEAPCRGASNEYPQHMFSLTNKKNIMWIPPLICSYELRMSSATILLNVSKGQLGTRQALECLIFFFFSFRNYLQFFFFFFFFFFCVLQSVIFIKGDSYWVDYLPCLTREITFVYLALCFSRTW